jgi:hypothetical protein
LVSPFLFLPLSKQKQKAMSIEEQHEEFERQENARLKAEKEFKEAKEVVEKLSDYVNYNKSRKAFIEAFKREHRTLQQSAFRMLLELVEEMATENYHTDGRNEQSKIVAQTLLKGFAMAKKQEYLNEGLSEERATSYVSGDGAKPSRYLPLI